LDGPIRDEPQRDNFFLVSSESERRLFWGLHVVCQLSAPLETVRPTEAAMDQDDKTGEVATSVEEFTRYNMLLPNAAYEIIADKRCLSSPSNGADRVLISRC
jgi:hypothetical protein